jgi:hypothetical protein
MPQVFRERLSKNQRCEVLEAVLQNGADLCFGLEPCYSCVLGRAFFLFHCALPVLGMSIAGNITSRVRCILLE